MAEEEAKEGQTVSLLLLGAGGSGKSTVLKQMTKIYSGDIDEKEMQDVTHFIRQNVLEDIYDICRQSVAFQGSVDQDRFHVKPDEKEHALRAKMADFEGANLDNIAFTPQLASEIDCLWCHKAIEATFQVRSKSHIMDNTPYFMKKVAEIAKDDYVPSFEDYVRVRHRTTGIIHSQFDITYDGTPWIIRVTDVGGQRTERRKWIACFAGVHAVIYVMSLSAYDQVLFEDHQTRCWDEDLDLFAKTVQHKAFHSTDFIVFLNKHDLFEKKIARVAFTEYDASFDAKKKHDGKAVIEYVKGAFTQRFYGEKPAKNSPRVVHFHVTCATATDNIETVMGIIQLDTVRKMMKQSALL